MEGSKVNLYILTSVVLICVLSIGYLYLQAKLLEKSLMLEACQQKITTLKAQAEQLEKEVKFLASLERIQKIAQEKLGMQPPTKRVFLASLPGIPQSATARVVEKQRLFEITD
ncbi:MAG: Cell division protein FtsL [Candidatus Atribacteria bacterium]|nr:Cell division protein FtsL [Candidatus Atribacteria bacterium]